MVFDALLLALIVAIAFASIAFAFVNKPIFEAFSTFFCSSSTLRASAFSES